MSRYTRFLTIRQQLTSDWYVMRPMLIVSVLALVPFVFIVPQCINQDASLFGYGNPRLDIIGRNDVFKERLPMIQRMIDESSAEYADKLCLAHIYDRIVLYDFVFLILIVLTGWIGFSARSRKLKEVNPDGYRRYRAEPTTYLWALIILIPITIMFGLTFGLAYVGMGFLIRDEGLEWLIDFAGPDWAFQNSMWFLITLGQLPKALSIFTWGAVMIGVYEISGRPLKR